MYLKQSMNSLRKKIEKLSVIISNVCDTDRTRGLLWIGWELMSLIYVWK